jgi:hypothetical protein
MTIGKYTMAGKGSKPRPLSVPRKQFDNNWDRIFGNKKRERTEKQNNRTLPTRA